MADMYARFEDRFDESDAEEENDEDIGALGSILSWDDEDEADEVEASVMAAESSALQQDRASMDGSMDGSMVFTHQVSGLSDAGSIGGMSFTIPMPNSVTEIQPAQEQQGQSQQATAAQPSQHSAQNGASPVVNPQQQAMNQFPVMSLAAFPMFQQPALFSQANAQQAMQFGMAQMMQQAHQQQQQQQTSQQTQQQQAAAQPQAQNAFASNMFFQQAMQQAAAQAQQQAAQHFSMQKARPMTAAATQPASHLRAALPPQPVPSMSMPQPMTSAPPQARKAPKRKAPPSTQPIASKPRTDNIVSCSDTDGETSRKNASTKFAVEKNDTADDEEGEDEDTYDMLDTSDMKPEEKKKINRDRNREHARNTRLRKKEYLEKLKATVDELCRERDTLVSERSGSATLLVEIHNTRTEVLMSFFALRSANEQRRELWASILDESCFSCVMPVTPYRSFPASEVQVSKCQRTILGIDGIMADTASLHVLLNTLIDRSRFPTAKMKFRFTLVTEDVVVAGNQMMARWAMTTVNAVEFGAKAEVSKQGMLCSKFNSAHKIIGLELMFDVMAFMLQLKQATGSESFSVVPNTVQTCQRTFDKPMVMTLAERPYTIVQVNKLWEDLTGYTAEDVVGKASCQVLQGHETDRRTLEVLMDAVRYKRPTHGMLVNYTRTGERFRNHLTLYPLSMDSKITHYVSLSTHTEVIGDSETSNHTPSLPIAAESSHQGEDSQQPLEGQAQLMSQSIMLPGARPTLALAPLVNPLLQGGQPTMPHPPLGFFAPNISMVNPAMPMTNIIPAPITKHAVAASVSTSSGDSRSTTQASGSSISI